MTTNTRTVVHYMLQGTDWVPTGREEETTPLCSVEIGQTAKGEVQVKGVKVYAVDVKDAEEQCLASLRRIQASILADPIPGLKGIAAS